MNATPRPHYEEIDWLDYVQDGLGPDARRALDAHLSGCASCRETVASMERLARALPGTLRLVERADPGGEDESAETIADRAASRAAGTLAGADARTAAILAAFADPSDSRFSWDTALLEEAASVGRERLRTDPASAGRILRSALAFAESRDERTSPGTVAALRSSFAYVRLTEGAVEEALSILDSVRESLDEAAVPEIELGFWHYVRSRALYAAARPAEALAEIRAARDLYELLEDRDRIFRCRQAEALLVSDLGDPRGAVRLYRRILEDTRLGDDRALHANLLMNYGLDLMRCGELEEARRVYLRSSALLKSTGQEAMLSRVRIGLAGIAERENRLEEALEMRFALRADYRTLSIPWEEIQLELDVAVLLLKLDRGAEAAAICAALLPRIESLGLEREAAKAVAYLAEAQESVDLAGVGRVRDFLRRLEAGEDLCWSAA